MDLNKLFPGDKDKKEAISCLDSLTRDPNWRFFSDKILQEDIRIISEQILNFKLDDDADRARESDMKRRRNYMIIMSQLPEKIIDALKSGKTDIPEFDPYFKAVKEIKEAAEKKS